METFSEEPKGSEHQPPENEQQTPSVHNTAEYAESFEELDDQAVGGQLDMLQEAFDKIENFDPANPAHMDLRNRMLGMQRVAAERGLPGSGVDLPSSPEDGDTDNNPDDAAAARYVLRNDGGQDMVTKAGAEAIDHGDTPPPAETLVSYTNVQPVAPKPKRAGFSSRFTSGRNNNRLSQ